ncbi:MAG TPA: DUF433 domain-containing protein [Bacteroidetes bacterium]|nr:DUF433 domain-containing protein [Bacteroidota bacterium]
MVQLKSITIDKEVLSGTPVFTGTRVPVKSLFDWLETEPLNEFLENFPSVKKEQALEVLSKKPCNQLSAYCDQLPQKAI